MLTSGRFRSRAPWAARVFAEAALVVLTLTVAASLAWSMTEPEAAAEDLRPR